VCIVGRSDPAFGGCGDRGTLSGAIRRRDETIRMCAEDASAVCKPDLGGGRRRRSTQPQPSVEVDMLAGMARRCWRVQLGCWQLSVTSAMSGKRLGSSARRCSSRTRRAGKRDPDAPRREVARPRSATAATHSFGLRFAILSSRLPKTQRASRFGPLAAGVSEQLETMPALSDANRSLEAQLPVLLLPQLSLRRPLSRSC
jgi:hypothetical protein